METTHDRDELPLVHEDELGVAAVEARAGAEMERVRLSEIHEIHPIELGQADVGDTRSEPAQTEVSDSACTAA